MLEERKEREEGESQKFRYSRVIIIIINNIIISSNNNNNQSKKLQTTNGTSLGKYVCSTRDVTFNAITIVSFHCFATVSREWCTIIRTYHNQYCCENTIWSLFVTTFMANVCLLVLQLLCGFPVPRLELDSTHLRIMGNFKTRRFIIITICL